MLSEYADVTVLNPRRLNFPMDNPAEARVQIDWERRALDDADIVLIWFCPETIQPIVLLELGAALMRRQYVHQQVYVGCHPDYKRVADVHLQCELADLPSPVANTLGTLLEQVSWCLRLGAWPPRIAK